jgi:hypothetical protein
MEIKKKSHLFFLLQYLAPLFTSSANTAKMASSHPYLVVFCRFQIARGKRSGANCSDSEKKYLLFCYLKGLGHEMELRKKLNNSRYKQEPLLKFLKCSFDEMSSLLVSMRYR